MFHPIVPPLPSHYISRPEVIGELKQSLFSPSQTGVLVVSAIYGLGGIGKSTVAAALARDPEVLSHFPDGVLWATLGQQPDLLSFLNSWIRALGDYDYKPTTKEAASEHLRTLLADKAALLVVDDVWDASHFEFFRVGSAECRVLVTTRSAPIQEASRIDLDVMEPKEALELLRRSLGGVIPSADEQLALTLAAEVGYLPLALELAAAQVVSGVSWSQLLADLTREVAALETLYLLTDARESEEVRKGYSLLFTLNLSLRQLPAEQLQMFALSWHLVQADRVDELHQLLQEETETGRNGWYEACDRLGELPIFLSDVASAWQQADAAFESSPSRAIALQCRYGLIMSSLNSLVGNIPAELMAALVSKGVWTLAQGLSYARQVQDQGDRANALGKLAAHLSENILQEALDTARAIQDEYSRARAISALAAHLPEHLLPEALDTARAIQDEYSRAFVFKTAQEIIFEQNLADALSALAAHLPEHLLPEGLSTVRAIQDSESLVEALRDLAAHLPEHLLPKALSTVRAINSERVRAKALSALAGRLPKHLLPKALSTVWAIKYEEARDDALSGLAAHLSENLLAEALSTVRAIQDKKARAKALSALAAYERENLLAEARAKAPSALAARMSEDLLPEALSRARAIQDDYSRAKALSALVPHFPEILPEALDTIRVIQYQENRAKFLCALAPHMTENLLPIALDIARAIRSKHVRAEPLCALVPRVPEILPEALDAARAITNDEIRAKALIPLVPHFPEILPEALNTVWKIQEPYYRAEAFSVIVRSLKRLPPNFSLWQEMLHTLACRDRSYFWEDLVELVPVIIKLGGTESLLEIARAIVDVGRQWP